MIAFVWDFDGVVAETPHEKAWELACKKCGISGFSHDFYSKHVSGRPRLEGARNILAMLAGKEPSNSGVERFASLKTRIYLELLEGGEYRLRRDVISFIQQARQRGIVQVLASASKNVFRLFEIVRMREGLDLASLFDLDVSGSGASKQEVFRNAIEKLRFTYSGSVKCIVFFDDAPSGVVAAKNLQQVAVGCFSKELLKYGADIVIEDFSALSLQGFLEELGCGL
ncbi:MAG: hypothetical protein LM590_04020 [Thermofilum sp.]|jgi:HAD superfamily hydrolase (TIGR01509 family)|nr:hypothetical protein [Thermofilum sp.]